MPVRTGASYAENAQNSRMCSAPGGLAAFVIVSPKLK